MKNGLITKNDIKALIRVPQVIKGCVLHDKLVVRDVFLLGYLTIVIILLVGNVCCEEDTQLVIGK